MREYSYQLIKFCGTLTDPTAKTESIGLPADALAVMVFAESFGQFHHDTKLTTITRTWYHQDSFIMTRQCSSVYLDWQKTRHRDGAVEKVSFFIFSLSGTLCNTL